MIHLENILKIIGRRSLPGVREGMVGHHGAEPLTA
jgi:hypothetical protein